MGGGASGQKRAEDATVASLRRRRRLLFGPDGAKFESTPPTEQYSTPLPEDAIFQRVQEVEELRASLQGVQYGNDGYLRENAIELLNLGLQEDSPLAKRLFRLAQVQHIVGGVRRQDALTCYEVLALYSLLWYGEEAEHLELLYCIFDADADDRLSAADLKIGIEAFLALPHALDALDIKDTRAMREEAKRLADEAVKNYSDPVTDADDPKEQQPDEEDEDERSKADTMSTTPARRDVSVSERRGEDREGEDGELDADASATRATSKDIPAQPSAKPRRRAFAALCGGKKPADADDSDSSRTPLKATRDGEDDGDTADEHDEGEARKTVADSPKEQVAPAAKAAGRPRRGLCSGRLPADDQVAARAQPMMAKPATKRVAAKRSLCSSFGSKKTQPPSLGYEQWKNWVAAWEFLEPGFGGLPRPITNADSPAKVGDVVGKEKLLLSDTIKQPPWGTADSAEPGEY